MPVLILQVRFHDGRFHGAGDWPPSPARLFQALVAAAARGDQIQPADREALGWLARLAPPTIFAPAKSDGQTLRNYVPNNDLDSVGGDPNRASKIKTIKVVRPRLFDSEEPFTYQWAFPEGAENRRQAAAVGAIASRLYRLGHGGDMAWARAAITDGEAQTEMDQGRYLPSSAAGDVALACPTAESLESLEGRHAAFRRRFTRDAGGKAMVFVQPPKPRFRPVGYNAAPRLLLFELRGDDEGFAPQGLAAANPLIVSVRDAAAARLRNALPDLAPLIDRALIGRDAAERDKTARLKLLALPSIGHAHADFRIRRLLVVAPPDCRLRLEDVSWAFSDTPVMGGRLVAAEDWTMLRHFGIADVTAPARVWQTLTPAALPVVPAPARPTGRQRLQRDANLAAAVARAVRHAGVTARPRTIRVQRTPYHQHGERAEAFAAPPRFPATRLWHVEVEFEEAVEGPMAIGDGRYLGLGLMAPAVVECDRPVVSYGVKATRPLGEPERMALLRAVRRALMSIAADEGGNVPKLIAGHEPDGAPDRSDQHDHIYLALDYDDHGVLDRLIVAAPWAVNKQRGAYRDEMRLLDRVVSQLNRVVAGPLGVIWLGAPEALANGDPLIGPARVWRARTPYRPTRHPRRGQPLEEFLAADLRAECSRRGLPAPAVSLGRPDQGLQGGFQARPVLRFAMAVTGPILLGRDCHFGGGLFAAEGN